MKKIYLAVFVALIAFVPHNASAYWRGGGGCCYGGPRFGFGIDFVAPVYAPAYPPVYGGYAYPAYPAPVYAAPPPQAPVYADQAPAQAASNEQCREYRGPIVIGGKTQQGYGTACLQPDGSAGTWFRNTVSLAYCNIIDCFQMMLGHRILKPQLNTGTADSSSFANSFL